MKTLAFFLMVIICSTLSFAQSEDSEDILMRTEQKDDTYLAGETIKVNAVINGN